MRLRATITHDQIPADARVTRVVAREGLSVVSDIDVEFRALDADLDVDSLLDANATVLVVDEQDENAAPTWFHGAVEEAEWVALRDDSHVYRVRLRPAVHALAYRVRTRTFQNKDVKQIVEQVLKDAGVPADGFEWRTAEEYGEREFCMQYKESELAFVQRLLEEEGIFFWFEHGDGKHVMVLADAPSAHAPVEGDTVFPLTEQEDPEREALADLVFTSRVTHDAHRTRDWNFESPTAPIEGHVPAATSFGLTRYEYPGGFRDATEAARRAQDRLDEALAARHVLEGVAATRRFAPGRKFDLVDARPEGLCREWLLTEVEHEFDEGGHASGDLRHRARFRAVPSDAPFRPPRVTPRPRVFGKESAVVTGPAGEEIHVDEYGRIKVHFYFDREGAIDDTASHWVRVQQMNTHGSMILPRVGWEVSVGFLDGDPDRPVVHQKLYNQETLPPYALPDNKTRGALQSSSSPGGGGTNEVRLEDGNGGMEFFVHASRDFALHAGHDMTEDVAVDAREQVGNDLSTIVASNETVSIGSNQSVSVTGPCSLETAGNKGVTVGAMDDWGVGKNAALSCGGDRTETISAMMNVVANTVSETFSAAHTRTVGAAQCINSVKAIVEAVGGDKAESVGAAKLELVRKAREETIKGSKTLLSGALVLRTGKDVTVEAKSALTVNVAGPIVEQVAGDFTFTAGAIVLTSLSAEIKVGGTKVTGRGGKLKFDAGSMGGAGGPMIQLSGGKVNYKP